MNLEYYGPLSSFAFNCNLRHYTVVVADNLLFPGRAVQVDPMLSLRAFNA